MAELERAREPEAAVFFIPHICAVLLDRAEKTTPHFTTFAFTDLRVKQIPYPVSPHPSYLLELL